jgi:MFS family permease
MPFALTNDPKLRCLVMAAAMVMFAINLDFFAVQAALPATALEFGVGTTQLQWVISGYMLALASGLVVGGRLADLLGRRTWLFIGAAVFGLASLVGGAATSAGVLVASRVVQGAGAAILMPVSIAVVTNAFAASQTQRAVGLVFGIAAVGQALGDVDQRALDLAGAAAGAPVGAAKPRRNRTARHRLGRAGADRRLGCDLHTWHRQGREPGLGIAANAGLAFVTLSGGVTLAAASSFIETRSAARSSHALMSSIAQVLIATGVLSVLFVPIVTWLGPMKSKGPVCE